MDKLSILIKRLRRLGIDITMFSNYPWIYLDTINNKKVKEKYYANHGWTIAWSPIRPGQQLEFTNIGELFKLIRKYL